MKYEQFTDNGFQSSGFLNFTPEMAYRKATELEIPILDVRESNLIGYKRFNVPHVFYIPLSELPARLSEIPKDLPFIVADSVGLRSHEAMEILIQHDFKNIANLAGGIVEWERDGMPLSINKTEQLDGSCMCQLRPRHKPNK
jgi:rhodanese-related sulfurtransferase